FRQGIVRIEEDAFGVGLNAHDADSFEWIRDSHGHHRYDLSIRVERAQSGDQVISWSLVLKDLRHPKAGNILMSAPEASLDPVPNLWKLDLSRSSAVPARVKRIIKVDGFYVTIEVQDVHFESRDAQYPDRADINLTLTNSDPRPRQ
ncbi:MAG: hypothetical protein WAN03_06125, partial [Candidatus Sulfotelmatobacter sp.]